MNNELPVVGEHTSIKDTIYAIERSGFDEALIVTRGGLFLGAVRSTDLRRLLISGVNENDGVGTYPPKYTISLSDKDFHSERRLEAALADLRLSGARYVPVVAADGSILETITVEELEARLGKLGSVKVNPDFSKTILVVGGAGYLGSILTRKLLAKGYTVRVLDSFLYGSRSLDGIAFHDRLRVVRGDMRNIHTCVGALEDVHSVVLLAAIVGDPSASARPTETIETNVLAAQAVASACKLQNIARFLYASTCSVYGMGAQVLDEGAPLNPASLYARTKIASEKAVLEMGDDYFCPTVLRMGTLYGDSPRMRFDLVVNTMTMNAFTDRRIRVFGGRQWRPLLNVEDAAEAYIACLEADIKEVANQVFNVGSDDQNYRIEEIARIVSASLGDVPIEHDESNLDARDYRVSFAKIQAALGFRPRHTVAGSARTIFEKLDRGIIGDPAQRIYFNHYFDSSEE